MTAVGHQHWRFGDAEVRVEQPGATVVVYEFRGRMVPELVPYIKQVTEPLVARGAQIALFFDTEKMSGYHPAFRSQMTEWHADLKPNTRSAGVLVRSRVIQMAIAVANLATGGLMVSYNDRRAFEKAIMEASRH